MLRVSLSIQAYRLDAATAGDDLDRLAVDGDRRPVAEVGPALSALMRADVSPSDQDRRALQDALCSSICAAPGCSTRPS